MTRPVGEFSRAPEACRPGIGEVPVTHGFIIFGLAQVTGTYRNALEA
jgi:hypothetical protein